MRSASARRARRYRRWKEQAAWRRRCILAAERAAKGLARSGEPPWPSGGPAPQSPEGMRRASCEEDLGWFEANYSRLRDEYRDEWIAISGRRVVSHGADPEEVIEEARRGGFPGAFITKVPGSWEDPFF